MYKQSVFRTVGMEFSNIPFVLIVLLFYIHSCWALNTVKTAQTSSEPTERRKDRQGDSNIPFPFCLWG